jgi:hypothetical protein
MTDADVFSKARSDLFVALGGDILDGMGLQNHFHRDTNEILRLDFPVASFGSYSQDQAVCWRERVLNR